MDRNEAESARSTGEEQQRVERELERMRHPLETASMLSKLTISWLDPLVAMGKKRGLTGKDLWAVPTKMRAACLTERFEKRFRLGAEANCNGPNALIKLFATIFLKEWLIAASCLIVWILSLIIAPIFLQAIIEIITEPDEYAANPFLGLTSPAAVVACLSTSLFIGALAGNTGFMFNILLGTKIRSTLIQLVFNKSLRVAPTATQSTGEVTSLMSNDTERVFWAVLFTQFLWIAPMTTILAVGALMAEPAIGPSSGGSALLVLSIVFLLQITLGKAQAREKKRMLTETDKRVSTTSETLSTISMVKMNAWEEKILDRIHVTREKEMKHGLRSLLLLSHNYALLFSTPSIIFLVVLSVIVLTNPGEQLSPAIVYTALAYVNVMRFPLTTLPRAIAAIAQAMAGLERISKFLNLPEQTASTRDGGDHIDMDGQDEALLSIKGGSFTWNDHPQNEGCGDALPPKPVLKGINLQVRRGEFVALVGKVASGKTSLLLSMLGEIGVIQGQVSYSPTCGQKQVKRFAGKKISIHVQGEEKQRSAGQRDQDAISYVAQEPWIQNCSLRENVVFQSLVTDPGLFEKCIRAAQLEADVNVLPNGLDTDIGDRGVNLSGGQRARVAIARCLYRTLTQNIPLVLLDDCFSALDPQVGLQVFNNMVTELLADRARVVVLNSQLHLLHRFDRIVALEEGRVVIDQPAAQALANPILARVIAASSFRADSSSSPCVSASDASTMSSSKAKTPTGSVSSSLQEDQEMELQASRAPLSREATKLYKAEAQEKGTISFHLYALWIKLSYPNSVAQRWVVGLALVVLFVGSQVLKVLGEYWVGFWTSGGSKAFLGIDNVSDSQGLAVFATILALMSILAVFRGVLFMVASTRSSVNLHKRVVLSILRAPVNIFFDVTPVGRILNRISSDLDKVDAMLPQQGMIFMQNFLQIISVMVLCVVASPFFVLILIPVLVLFIWVGNYFAHSSRDVKRIDNTTRSPLFSMFAETLAGLATVRAFRVQTQLCKRMSSLIDKNVEAFLTFWVASRWLALRLDMLIVLLQTSMAILAISLRSAIDPSVVALALVYSLTLSGVLQFTVRLYVEVQNYFTSIERLVDYADDIPQEQGNKAGDYHGKSSISSSTKKDTCGSIDFYDVTVRYRPGLPLVLEGVSFSIAAGSKVGIIGRTGSGKSTLGACLFRMIHPGLERGTISIDGVDIAQIPLRNLRRMLGVISQTPFLFSGSLRFNLDPWSDHTDQEILKALELVGLSSLAAQGLDMSLASKASNLSVGQRQLVQICRTMLQNPKLVLCDEATANVDSLSDEIVQRALKVQFHSQTVLTVAHRLSSLVSSDKIVVLSFGKLVEYGSPAELLDNKAQFYEMVSQSGLLADFRG